MRHKMRKVMRLRALRRSREITQSELAKRVGVRHSTISAIEAGHIQPSMKTARAIASEFNLSIEEVFSYVEVQA